MKIKETQRQIIHFVITIFAKFGGGVVWCASFDEGYSDKMSPSNAINY